MGSPETRLVERFLQVLMDEGSEKPYDSKHNKWKATPSNFVMEGILPVQHCIVSHVNTTSVFLQK